MKNMDSENLIFQVAQCRAENWKNSDISEEGEILLGKIADHFEHCTECRKAFDAQEYPEKTIIEFANERLAPNPALESWICKE
jgi:hypothetical protein